MVARTILLGEARLQCSVGGNEGEVVGGGILGAAVLFRL